jgi:hypothetical protein
MAKDAALRPQSALDLARALQAVEQDQGLPLTRIVVAADPPGHQYDDDRTDATRVRRPVQISAQPVSQPSGDPQPLAAPAAETAPTSRRPKTATPTDGEPVAGGGSGVRPAWIVAGVAALAVLGFLISNVVSGGGDSTANPKRTLSSEPTDTNAVIVPPPGKPTVKASRIDRTRVRFTWSYENPLSDDTFRYTSKAAKNGVTDKPTVELTGRVKQPVCVSVVVFRKSGASVSDPSAEVCGR